MSIVFLIGGTGNQLFQYAASEPDDRFSTVFLRPGTRQLLGWTKHEQVIVFDEASLLRQVLGFGILIIDLALAKLSGRSMFSTLDAKRFQARPLFKEFVRLGYFQQAPERRSVARLADQFAPTAKPGQIIIHIRGGDLLALERAGQNVYGKLNARYYREGIFAALANLTHRGQPVTELLVLTDDPKYAGTLDLKVNGAPEPQIKNLPLKETLSLAVGADWFVSSNSTMAYWILRLRKGVRSVAPSPFQRRSDFPLPDDCLRVPMDAED